MVSKKLLDVKTVDDRFLSKPKNIKCPIIEYSLINSVETQIPSVLFWLIREGLKKYF